MVHAMTEPVKQDALEREAEEILRENRIVLERSEHTGERLLAGWYAYTEAVHDLLREAGIELPQRDARRRRRDRRRI